MPSKEEMSKVGGLIAAIVAVFGCAAWRMVGASAKPAAAAPTEQVGVEMKPESTPAAAVPTTNNPDKAPIEVASTVSTGTVDPFRTLIPKNEPAINMPNTLGGQIAPGKLTAIPGGPMEPGKLLPVQLPKEDELRLTGVLPGPNGVAVIEVNKESYVLHAGQQINKDLTLATIGTDRVAVIQKGKRIRLILGE